MTVKKFTREQVSKYNSNTELVFIIDNVVYDVTKYVDEHPGGREVFFDAAGTDASKEFDDIGHSLDANELLTKFEIGELVDEERIDRKKRGAIFGDNNEEDKGSSTNSWIFFVLLGVVVTVLYTYLFS